MLASVAALGLQREHEATLVDYLVRAAYMLVNAPDPENA
jgi:truncated hemoglobin YjbI